MFSTVTLVLFMSCCGVALSSPYWNSYWPGKGSGKDGYWNSYVPQYGNYWPQQYPGYPGGGWQGDNVGSQSNSVDGTGNYVGWQKNYVN
ncbi:hypothetical protein DPMN_163313 [Dreissena polymorpha]|uniref:Uncharacterized protein n=1 Tax=Dreissena polymorpha TaxID=45954 RepID=A0A9D4ET81_DREPO|nr:hypothetical protein DPMN_163313 [Dreissena polymorpha]